MRIAYLDDKRIHIDEYEESMSGNITCSEGHSVIAKRGQIKIHHFAHKSGCICIGSDGMSEWHKDWQNRALKDAQEVRLENNGKKHIADTLCNIPISMSSTSISTMSLSKGYVIEYQHSSMTEAVMKERESFYTGIGYHLVWVFDTYKWEYVITTRRKPMMSDITNNPILKDKDIISLRCTKGDKFPMWSAYTGGVTRILDFGKKDLFVVIKQIGITLTGYCISMEEFDKQYLGSYVSKDNDMRIFKHGI